VLLVLPHSASLYVLFVVFLEDCTSSITPPMLVVLLKTLSILPELANEPNTVCPV